MKNTSFRPNLLASSFLATSLVFGTAGIALAQEADIEEKAIQETVTVTGSRIKKEDFSSISPISSVGAEQFIVTGTINTESLLNTLPQVVPGLDNTSNNPGGGFATVDLRGLGENRTLVLVDGRRMVPTTGEGVVDINNIPTSLIDRVEVITGGASAVYGSDAVAGVVNFILKDDFEGVELSVGAQQTGEGDAGLYSLDLTIGGNFADDRGNVVLNLGYTSREELFQDDRDFSTFAQFDDGAGNLFDGGSSGVPQGAIFGGANFNFADGTSGAGIFNTDGTIRRFITSGDNNDFFNFAPDNYIQLPQERLQATALAHYDITDTVKIYSSAMLAANRVPQQLAPTPIFQSGTTFTLDGNPFIAPSAQQIISNEIGGSVDTDGDGISDTATVGAFGIRRRMVEVGPRRSEDEFVSFQFTGGITSEITDIWSLDFSLTEGRVLNSFSQLGNINRDRFEQSLLLATDANGQVVLDANGNPSCADTSSNGATSACVPLNLFGAGNISEESAAFLRTAVVGDGVYDVTTLELNLTGDTSNFFSLPGGPIGLAFGGQYRDENFDFRPSQDLAAGTIAGFNGAPAEGGGFDVYGIYGEAYLPIVKDAPFAHLLALELAGRLEDYSTAGETDAFKVSGEWAPVEDIRFRASYNTAVRAPSIVELFSPQSEGFPSSTDPCGSNFNGDATTRAICEGTGVPAANVGTALIDLPAGQVRELSGGNPDLEAEEAETLTIGAVYEPNFVPGLKLAVDYFDIEITDVIEDFGGGANNVLTTCYTDQTLGGLGSPFCNAITRGGGGTITQVAVTSQNVASLELTGFDIQGEYTFETGFGDIILNYVGTITDTNTLVPFEGGTPITCAGEFGADCGEPVPEYKHRATIAWFDGPFSAQLLWRYVGSVKDDGGLGFQVAVDEIDAYNYFDLSGSWDVNDNVTLVGGIGNLLNEEPPILGDNQEQANTYPATYDVFGRDFFVTAKFRF